MTLNPTFCPFVSPHHNLEQLLTQKAAIREECEIAPGCFHRPLLKIDITFEHNHQIKLFKVIMVANKTVFLIKESL